MSKGKGKKPKPQPINWTDSIARLWQGVGLLNPLVLPKIQAAVDKEVSKSGTGEKDFKDACKDIIKDAAVVESLWKDIVALLENQINGYCW